MKLLLVIIIDIIKFHEPDYPEFFIIIRNIPTFMINHPVQNYSLNNQKIYNHEKKLLCLRQHKS